MKVKPAEKVALNGTLNATPATLIGESPPKTKQLGELEPRDHIVFNLKPEEEALVRGKVAVAAAEAVIF